MMRAQRREQWEKWARRMIHVIILLVGVKLLDLPALTMTGAIVPDVLGKVLTLFSQKTNLSDSGKYIIT